MAKISTYPILSTPSINDLLIGTDVDNLNITKNFSIGDIASFIIGGSYVPYIGATENVDLGAFDITSSAFIVGGGLATQFLKADGTLDSTVYQPAGNYITQLSGEATASGPGNASVTLSNSAVINKVLTGLTVTGSVIAATDSILTAFGKVQNQINTLVGGVQYQGTWNADTNTPTLTSSVGIQGHYYVVSVPGSTNLNGITDWKLGDWAIYNGTAWDKIDNTDAVISVNGEVGAVVLTTTNISEGTNLYFTNSRARTAINLTTTGNSGAATYNNTNGFFNIPEYTLAGLGGVPLTRQLTINGTAFDLSANRSWNVGTVTSVGTSAPLTGGTITGSGTIGITQATATIDGYLSSTDWATFNSKQNAITNPVTGTGTAFFLPMWGSASSLINSPLSYASDAFTFGYNSATGGTVNFTNSGLTPYTYSIQMNNFGSPRSTIHSYTDGVVVQSIGGTQVSRIFANGNTLLGIGLVDNGNKLEIEGSLKVNTISNATTDTDRFLVSDSGVVKYRTGTELRSDIGAGVGSVTSVGLTMPSAFSVANSPITGSGTLAVTGAGNASQYVRGDGTLADFPATTGGGSSVSYYLNGSVSQGTIGGVAYRELSEVPIFGAGTDISIAADGYIASFLTDAGDPALLNIPAGNWNFETYFSASSGGGSPSFYVELYRYDGTTFTLIASSSSVPELISFGTNIQPYFSTLAVPQTALALTDRLAIRYYVVTSGRTITLHTEDNHLCQVITTFSNGLTALNGLTEQVQYFQVGTAGTDFNIVSSVATHTFNLPTASATNRGLLSTTDWTIFNNKQNALGFTPVPETRTITINGTNQDLSANRTFNVGDMILGEIQTVTGRKDFNTNTLNLAVNGTSQKTVLTNSPIDSGSYSLAINFFGFNASNNLYFSKGGDNNGIFAFSNAVTRTYTLQNASGTLAFTSDITNALTGFVTLDTTQSITGTKTFTSSILLKNSPSLAGLILQSFSSNALEVGATISGTTYYSSITFPAGAQNWNLPNTSGTIALTSDLAGYVTLGTTQTITGQKTFSTSGGSDTAIINHGSGSGIALNITKGGNNEALRVAKTSGSGNAVTITGGLLSAEAATLTGALNGTSATFAGTGGVPSLNVRASDANFALASILGNQAGDVNWLLMSGFPNAGNFTIRQSDTVNALVIQKTTGAATFSSSVQATRLTLNNSGTSARLQVSGVNSEAIAYLYNNSGTAGSVPGVAIEAGTNSSDYALSVASSLGTSYFRVRGDGNVGIGTASPSSKLDVRGSGVLLSTISSNSADGVSSFYSINNSGKSNELGIWGSTRTSFGAIQPNNGYIFSNDDLAIGSAINLKFSTGESNSERMRITSVGNTQPGADNAYSLGVSGTRWSAVWAANGTIQTSDEREKKDIVDSDLGLDLITKLRPVSFKWKVGQNVVTSEVVKDEEGNPILDEEGNEKTESVLTPREGKRTHYGLIAQEVEEVLDGKDFGGFIHDEETDTKGLRYDQFVPLLIKSIQELNDKIAILESKLK